MRPPKDTNDGLGYPIQILGDARVVLADKGPLA